jgi:nucleotide-binding universal stress UspA family protein
VKTIVVGYDGSDGAKRALDRAVEVARAFSAKLVVVSVADLPPVVPPYAAGPVVGFETEPILDPTLLSMDPDQIVGPLLDEARELVRGVDAEFESREGAPDDVLLAVADERAADLLVVGKRELGFIGRLLEGSVSVDLAKRAHCDVLIVHPPHAKT